MKKFFQSFIRDEEGATMVEYGIMVALIAAISIGIVGSLGGSVFDAFTTIDNAMPAAGS